MPFVVPRKPARSRLPKIRSQPIVGMRDVVDPQESSPVHAKLLQNFYIDPRSGILPRPGFAQAGGTVIDTTQCLYQLVRLSANSKTFRVGSGTIQVYAWATDTWSTDVITANLTTASITLSSTVQVFAANFADLVVISDGVNLPFTWDGSSGAGGLTSLTNAAVFYGKPVVYYAKLFGIKNADRKTIVWSEELTPNTGYEAGGYDNAWTLGQTDQSPLFALAATNEALYYFRAFSIGKIVGAVSTDFATSGTQEYVSQTVGTSSPDATLVHKGHIWFVDSEARPQRLAIGGILQDSIWLDAQETIASLSKKAADLKRAWCINLPFGNLVAFGIVSTANTGSGADKILLYDADSGQFVGTWSLASNVAGRVMLARDDRAAGWGATTTDLPVLFMGLGTTVYKLGTPDGSTWTDAGTAITRIVDFPPFAYDSETEKLFSELRVLVRHLGSSNITSMTATVTTPAGTSSSHTLPTQTYADVEEKQIPVGLNTFGRWARVKLTHATSGERFAIGGIELVAAGGTTAAQVK